MYTGLVAGQAEYLSGIVIDAKGDGKANIVFSPQSQKIALGLYEKYAFYAEHKILGVTEEYDWRVFYVEDPFELKHVEEIKDCEVYDFPDSKDKLYSFDMCNMPCSVRVCRADSQQITSLIMMINGVKYELTQKADSSVNPSFGEEIEGFLYSATVDEENKTVKFSKTAPKCLAGGAKLVTDYSEVKLGDSTVWTTDKDGKPILK